MQLYTLNQAAAELKHTYPMLEFATIGDALVHTVFGQCKIEVTVDGNQFVTCVVMDDPEDLSGYEYNPVVMTTFACDSAPMGVNQVVRKFERYFRGMGESLERIDRVTKKRKRKCDEPPLITHEQRLRINTLLSEGFKFDGVLFEEAEAFIEEVG